MTTKTRFTSSKIVLLSLTVSLFSMTAQADLLGVSPLAIPANLNLNQNLITNDASPGLFETGLGNVGKTVDTVIGGDVQYDTAQLGQVLDGAYTRIPDYSRRIRDAISLGYVYGDTVRPIVTTTQTALNQVGSNIQQTPLPLNAEQAGGKLLTGLSDTVGSVGTLLQGDPNGPDPLISVVGHATGTVAAVTDSLFQGSSPRAAPGSSRNQNLSLTNTMAAQPGPLETSLANLGQTVDNIVPLSMKNGGQYLGGNLDKVVAIKEIERLSNRIRDAISKDYVLDANGNRILISTEHSIDILGNIVENTNLPLNAGPVAGTLLHGVSDTVGSARGLLYNDLNNPYPISSTLENLTGSLAATTDALLHGGNQLQPLLGAQTTALNNNAGLLAPVTNLVSSVTGGLGGDSANNQGLLAPITGMLGNGLLSPSAAATETPPDNTVVATNVGLLSPVTGLVNGLLGAPPR